MNPEKVIQHLERRIKCDGLKFTTSDILTQDYGPMYEKEELDPDVPSIDHRLWHYREVVAFILERDKDPGKFYYEYYRPLTGKLGTRVFAIKWWLKDNRSKYPSLEGKKDGVTSGPSSVIAQRHVLKVPTTDYGDELLFSRLRELQESWHRDRTMSVCLDMPEFINNPASLFPNLVEEAMIKKRAKESQLMQIL